MKNQVRIVGGKVYLNSHIYDNYFKGIESLAPVLSGKQLLLHPLWQSGVGGILIKYLNAKGDRVVELMDFFRNNKLDDSYKGEVPAKWNDTNAALVVDLEENMFPMIDKGDAQFNAAIEMVNSEEYEPDEKADMLMQIAMSLQTQPKTPQHILHAVELYNRALKLCPGSEVLLIARIQARMATALLAYPSQTDEYLLMARDQLTSSLEKLKSGHGLPEEIAEAELNLGLILQNLVPYHKALLRDAISAYQKSLKVFTKEKYPAEFAILHSNLATAYLSTPLTDKHSKMREALAVQSFEEALSVLTIEDNPSEYAMLQNNLGNALQYSSSSHSLENNVRALEAYDEALRVRTPETTPVEYANTVSNKANVLRNLPQDEVTNGSNLHQAKSYYEKAKGLFVKHHQTEKANMVQQALKEVDEQLQIGLQPAK